MILTFLRQNMKIIFSSKNVDWRKLISICEFEQGIDWQKERKDFYINSKKIIKLHRRVFEGADIEKIEKNTSIESQKLKSSSCIINSFLSLTLYHYKANLTGNATLNYPKKQQSKLVKLMTNIVPSGLE